MKHETQEQKERVLLSYVSSSMFQVSKICFSKNLSSLCFQSPSSPFLAGLGARFVFAQIGWYEPTDTPPIDNEIPLWIRVGNNLYHTTGGWAGFLTNDPKGTIHLSGGQTWGTDLNLDSTGLFGGRRWLLISTGGNASEGTGKFLVKDNNASAVRLVIDANGNVGIGTTSPASKLEIVNSSSASDVYGIKTAASSSYGGYERIYGIYSTASAAPYSGDDFTVGVYGDASSTRGLPVGVYGSGGTRGRGVYGSGAYGVYGSAYGISTGTGVMALGGYYGLRAIGQNVGVYADGADYGIYSTSAKNYFTGNVGIKGDIDISGSNRWIIHSPDDGRTTLHLAPWGTTNWNWGAGTTFTNNGDVFFPGNVGIGTTSPSEKFVVKEGNIYVSGRDKGLILRDPRGKCRKITVDSAGALQVSSAFTCPDVVYLVNRIHDADACPSAGGTIVTSGENSFCRFGGASCPSGWSRYNSWSTTTATTCNGKNYSGCSGATSCTTGSHTFSNAGQETCSYNDRAFRVYRCRDFGQTCVANITEVGCY